MSCESASVESDSHVVVGDASRGLRRGKRLGEKFVGRAEYAGMDKTESVTSDALDLLREWIVVARSIAADIAKLEKGKSKGSKREKAIARWEIFLCVMLVKAAEAVADLAPTKNVRAMTILARSLFEYQQKAQYFLAHRKDAFEQYASIGARKYVSLSKMRHPDPNVAVRLGAEYLDWKRTSGNRDERSGAVTLSTMHLRNTNPSKIKTDKDGNEYTEAYEISYGFPAWYIHGGPTLMPEVFPRLSDDSNWSFRENVTNVDPLSVVNSANASMLLFCEKTTRFFGLDLGRIAKLKPHILRVLRATAAVHEHKWTIK